MVLRVNTNWKQCTPDRSHFSVTVFNSVLKQLAQTYSSLPKESKMCVTRSKEIVFTKRWHSARDACEQVMPFSYGINSLRWGVIVILIEQHLEAHIRMNVWWRRGKIHHKNEKPTTFWEKHLWFPKIQRISICVPTKSRE